MPYRITYDLFGRQWQEIATLPAARALAAYLHRTFRIESTIERVEVVPQVIYRTNGPSRPDDPAPEPDTTPEAERRARLGRTFDDEYEEER